MAAAVAAINRSANRDRAVRPALHALDEQIAATALIHSLSVVTRNERHFAQTGVDELNPFDH